MKSQPDVGMLQRGARDHDLLLASPDPDNLVIKALERAGFVPP